MKQKGLSKLVIFSRNISIQKDNTSNTMEFLDYKEYFDVDIF